MEQVLISELHFADYNPRQISKHDFESLKNSIKEFGFVEPVVANKDKTVIGGHQRIRAAEAIGIKEVPVVYVDITKDKERLLNLALNRISGEWDEDSLAELIYTLKEENADIKLSGFLDSEITGFLDRVSEITEDEVPKLPKEAITKEGDLYLLGNHKLLCGDSTKIENFRKLLGEEKIDLVFTDPPYNIDYKSLGGNSYDGGKYSTGKKIFSDNKSPEEYLQFLKDILTNIYTYSKEKIAVFMWNGDKNIDLAIRSLKETNFPINQICIWIKNGFTFCPGNIFHKAIEYCALGLKDGHRPKFNKSYVKNHNNIFDLDFEKFTDHLEAWYKSRDPLYSYEHPTQKPVRLAGPALKACSEENDIVFDAFGGSGSTLIACEQLNRKCYMMELDPKYCDVIVKRWENFTGNKAELIRGEVENNG